MFVARLLLLLSPLLSTRGNVDVKLCSKTERKNEGSQNTSESDEIYTGQKKNRKQKFKCCEKKEN